MPLPGTRDTVGGFFLADDDIGGGVWPMFAGMGATSEGWDCRRTGIYAEVLSVLAPHLPGVAHARNDIK